MFDVAQAAVEAALAAGARYADARVMINRAEHLGATNGVLETLDQSESAGVGVRALIGSSWGFAATSDLGTAVVKATGEEAVAIARASQLVRGPDLDLAAADSVEASWTSSWQLHPLDDVSLSDRAGLLVDATTALQGGGVPLGRAASAVWDSRRWFVSSEGARIDQHLVSCGAVISATAIGDGETQERSYPGSVGQYGQHGWELVTGFDLVGEAARVADEAQALVRAPQCPEMVTDLILGGEQVALQIHESVGHAIELDRILGWEAAYAGTSWLDLQQLGSLRFGSDLMNITADATVPGGMGSFGFDDEGTPAQRVDICREGVWVGVLSGRDSAPHAGLTASGGMVRADGWARLPMVRMTNVGLLPGESTLEEIVAATDDGIFMDTNRSWSIDDKRLNFQFGCELAWEVKGGRRTRMLRNPTYTGIGPQFWGSLDMLAGGDEMVTWGMPNCGKGQPSQVGHTGHSAAPARFRGVRVGVRG